MRGINCCVLIVYEHNDDAMIDVVNKLLVTAAGKLAARKNADKLARNALFV